MHTPYSQPVVAEPIADAIRELEASANDSAEARVWLAVLAEVLELDENDPADVH